MSSSFRLPSHVLSAIVQDLTQNPSKIGVALLKEYEALAGRFERNVYGSKDKEPQMDYDPELMDEIQKRGKRLAEWFEAMLKDRKTRKKR